MCNREKFISFLVQNKITVSCAESCTGGLLSSSFVTYPGVSSVFLEGAVTYSNEAKKRLGVRAETLEQYGAVSHQTAREMAECIRVRTGSRIGLSTTGIAGPDGGTRQKPVGLVYVAVATDASTTSFALRLSGNRTEIRNKTVSAVYTFFIKKLEEDGYGAD